MIKDKSPPFQDTFLVEQTEYTLQLALVMRLFIHTAIIWLYVSVIMAEAIISCQLKRPASCYCVFRRGLCCAFLAPHALYHYFSSSRRWDFVCFINSGVSAAFDNRDYDKKTHCVGISIRGILTSVSRFHMMSAVCVSSLSLCVCKTHTKSIQDSKQYVMQE